MKYTAYIIVVVCLFCSCKKIKYNPDTFVGTVETKVLAHRANGGNDENYKENTFAAAVYGLSVADGIEIDIQVSKNRTIWLSHEAQIIDCHSGKALCIPDITDNEITNSDTCFIDEYRLCTLDSVFAYMTKNFPTKHISIDVKAWEPCSISSSNIISIMNVIAQKIIELTNKYELHDRVLVESETTTFLSYIKGHSNGIECYLTILGDFERGMMLSLQEGYTGISFKYKFKETIDSNTVAMLHRKGLKIQLWTVNTPEDIQDALAIDPDFIQTDNIVYFINPNK